MPSVLTSTNAIVLYNAPHGESFTQFHLLSPILGKVIALKRIPKSKPSPNPDIFDSIEASLSQNQNNSPHFLQEFHVIHHHADIAKNYDAFLLASQFTNILSKNLPFLQDFPFLFNLTQVSLNSFATHNFPQATFLKAIFSLTKNEGVPLNHWLSTLPSDQQILAHSTIFSPIAELHVSPLNSILNSIQHYLKHNSHFIID